MEWKARLHPIWVGGRTGYVYSIIYDGHLLIERSRDPECDAARALLAKGLTGKLTLCDGETGMPRTIIDIQKAAGLMTSEENRSGLRFRKALRTTDNSTPSPGMGSVEAA